MATTTSKELLVHRYQLCQTYGYEEAAKQEGISKETIRRNCRAYRAEYINDLGTDARSLVFDIENSPSMAYIWGLWQETRSTDFIKEDWYVMSWAAKWLGEDEKMCMALPDYEGFAKDPRDDKALLTDLWHLLNEADIVIAHNGKKFDCRKINARFIINGMTPPSPYKIVDTLLEARRNFAFTSNKLSDLAKYLKVRQKIVNSGFQLWKDCMDGDLNAWALMKEYNVGDIDALEDIYYKLLPYMASHPNMGIYTNDDIEVCAACGSADISKQGGDKGSYTNLSKFPMYRCNDCGGWSRGRKSMLDQEKRNTLLSKIAK